PQINPKLQIPNPKQISTTKRKRRADLELGALLKKRILVAMALVRILVDGYSLLHNWPELAPGRPRHSAAARDELIQRLTKYQDAIETPITIFFDGGGAPTGTPAPSSTPELEVLYSRSGQTADQMIERAAHRFAPYGEVLAVTDDLAERDTVISLGGMA